MYWVRIYDGSFPGGSVPGWGGTTVLLERNGIQVFSEKQTAEAEQYLERLEHP